MRLQAPGRNKLRDSDSENVSSIQAQPPLGIRGAENLGREPD